MSDDHDLRRFRQQSESLAELTRNIRVLSVLSWPASVRDAFLADWRAGRARLPQVEYEPVDHGETIAELEKLEARIDSEHPVGAHLLESTRACRLIARLIQARGSAEMLEHSLALYGRPGDELPGGRGRLTNVEAAEHFLESMEVLDNYTASDEEAAESLTAELARDRLVSGMAEVFDPGDRPEVQIDPELVSKAAASSSRIRLRGNTGFSETGVRQLLHHEAFVHSLTKLNGQLQHNLPSLGVSAPRTTGTQEGLATFAELVTGNIDLHRLERISLRIVAVDMALNGADFIQVFEYLISHGQPPRESFNSAMRIFRGAPLTGGYAFTKDTVYLHGLLSVYTFFLWALRERRMDLCRWLFAGRMTVSDVLALEPWFESGWLESPRYCPPWLTSVGTLAAQLAFDLFTNKLHIAGVSDTDLSSDPVIGVQDTPRPPSGE